MSDAEAPVQRKVEDAAEKTGCDISGVLPPAVGAGGSSKLCPKVEFKERPMFAGLPPASGECSRYEHIQDGCSKTRLQGRGCAEGSAAAGAAGLSLGGCLCGEL